MGCNLFDIQLRTFNVYHTANGFVRVYSSIRHCRCSLCKPERATIAHRGNHKKHTHTLAIAAFALQSTSPAGTSPQRRARRLAEFSGIHVVRARASVRSLACASACERRRTVSTFSPAPAACAPTHAAVGNRSVVVATRRGMHSQSSRAG